MTRETDYHNKLITESTKSQSFLTLSGYEVIYDYDVRLKRFVYYLPGNMSVDSKEAASEIMERNVKNFHKVRRVK